RGLARWCGRDAHGRGRRSSGVRVSGQRGSVSVLLAAGILVVLVLVLGVSDGGRVLVARSKARTAADAAALAAADELALPTGADPAALAAEYATRNGAHLTASRGPAG